MSVIKHVCAASLAGLAALALFSTMATPAAARSNVSVGIGIGFPVYGPGYGYGYGHGYHHRHRHHYGPRYRGYYRPYYPPPVIYAPPPAVVYVPPPAYYQQPVQAIPTSEIYRANNGQYCREYQSTVRINGELQNSYGTACQQPDGVWRVVN